MTHSALKETSSDWKIMFVLMIGVFLSPLNLTFTSIALPTMRTYFSVNIEQATWLGTAYFIPSVTFMPLQTYIGGRLGARRIYAMGMVLLSLGAFLSAIVPDFRWLLASRVLQGIGWSALFPLGLVLIQAHYPETKQGGMMGIWESATGFATIVAPIVGGFLVEYYRWQTLYIILGVGAGLGAVLTPLIIPPRSREPRKVLSKFDWGGAIQLTAFLTLLLFGISRRNLPILLVSLIIGWFWQREAWQKKNPFLPPQLFTNKWFMNASIAANLRVLVAMGVLIALPLFFEDVQGTGPATVGMLMVIYSLFLFFTAWPGGIWADRSGVHVPGLIGYTAMFAGVLLMMPFGIDLNILLVAIALSLRGVGAGLTQAPYAKAATAAVKKEHAQVAAGLYGTMRYSGLALGTALAGIFLQIRLTHYNALTGGPEALPAYRELWLLLAGIAFIGLGLTWGIKRNQQVDLDLTN